MSANSKIEWTDHTFNPWIGCTRVSPACDSCYAAVSTPARAMKVGWGPHEPRHRTAPSTWKQPLAWNRRHEAFFAEHGRRQRVFCASLADVFDNAVPIEWLRDVCSLIELTPKLDWLLLTKRIGIVFERLIQARSHDWLAGQRNVSLGITVVNQQEADRDIQKLLSTPARVRFLSMEPLLGPVDLSIWLDVYQFDDQSKWSRRNVGFTAALDWTIVGGESGPGARPMHPDWARGLRDQCQAAGVPFLFKQWGEWTPGENVERQRGTVDTAFLWDGKWSIHSLNLATDHGHIDDQPDLYRVGKKAAGRLLDGREWNQVPGTSHG